MSSGVNRSSCLAPLGDLHHSKTLRVYGINGNELTSKTMRSRSEIFHQTETLKHPKPELQLVVRDFSGELTKKLIQQDQYGMDDAFSLPSGSLDAIIPFSPLDFDLLPFSGNVKTKIAQCPHSTTPQLQNESARKYDSEVYNSFSLSKHCFSGYHLSHLLGLGTQIQRDVLRGLEGSPEIEMMEEKKECPLHSEFQNSKPKVTIKKSDIKSGRLFQLQSASPSVQTNTESLGKQNLVTLPTRLKTIRENSGDQKSLHLNSSTVVLDSQSSLDMSTLSQRGDYDAKKPTHYGKDKNEFSTGETRISFDEKFGSLYRSSSTQSKKSAGTSRTLLYYANFPDGGVSRTVSETKKHGGNSQYVKHDPMHKLSTTLQNLDSPVNLGRAKNLRRPPSIRTPHVSVTRRRSGSKQNDTGCKLDDQMTILKSSYPLCHRGRLRHTPLSTNENIETHRYIFSQPVPKKAFEISRSLDFSERNRNDWSSPCISSFMNHTTLPRIDYDDRPTQKNEVCSDASLNLYHSEKMSETIPRQCKGSIERKTTRHRKSDALNLDSCFGSHRKEKRNLKDLLRPRKESPIQHSRNQNVTLYENIGHFFRRSTVEKKVDCSKSPTCLISKYPSINIYGSTTRSSCLSPQLRHNLRAHCVESLNEPSAQDKDYGSLATPFPISTRRSNSENHSTIFLSPQNELRKKSGPRKEHCSIRSIVQVESLPNPIINSLPHHTPKLTSSKAAHTHRVHTPQMSPCTMKVGYSSPSSTVRQQKTISEVSKEKKTGNLVCNDSSNNVNLLRRSKALNSVSKGNPFETNILSKYSNPSKQVSPKTKSFDMDSEVQAKPSKTLSNQKTERPRHHKSLLLPRLNFNHQIHDPCKINEELTSAHQSTRSLTRSISKLVGKARETMFKRDSATSRSTETLTHQTLENRVKKSDLLSFYKSDTTAVIRRALFALFMTAPSACLSNLFFVVSSFLLLQIERPTLHVSRHVDSKPHIHEVLRYSVAYHASGVSGTQMTLAKSPSCNLSKTCHRANLVRLINEVHLAQQSAQC